MGDVAVEDFPNAVTIGKEQAIRRTFTLKAEKAPANLYLRAATGSAIDEGKDGVWHVTDGAIKFTVVLKGDGKAKVRDAGGRKELLFEPRFANGKAEVTATITTRF